MKKLNYFRYCLILISLVLISFNVFAQSGAWTKKANMLSPRGGTAASVIGDKIYVIGGGLVDLADNEVYNPSTDTWEKKAPTPTARGFLTTAVVSDTIYVIGGGYPTLKLKVEAYHPETNSWTTKNNMTKGRLCCNSSCVIDGIIYIVGGNYNERECWAYNPVTDEWTQKTSMPLDGGGGVSVTAYNGLVYTFGGSTYSPWAARKSVYAYDPQTDMWTKKKDMPTARFAFQTYLVNEKIYAIGGSQSENSSVSTVEVYDPITDTWETKPNMPNNNAWFTGAVVNNKIYVVGGSPNWSTSLGEVWEYNPSYNTSCTDVAAGNVSGTWTLSNSPYHINGEITIPNSETLIIEPGVEIVFTGHYKLNVQGRLLAVGTNKDTIRFTAEDKSTGWHGIRFTDTPNSNDTSKIIYCSIRYGNANTGSGVDRCGGAIMIKDFDKVLISNSLIDSNKQSGDGWDPPEGDGGIWVYHASPIISNNTFSNNYSASKSSALGFVDCPNPKILNNTFVNNIGVFGAVAFVNNSNGLLSGNFISNNIATYAAGGILIDCSLVPGFTNPRVENNIIVHNYSPIGGGILCYDNANPVLINNTIAFNSGDNGGGICFGNSDPILINNILFGNSATSAGHQVFIMDNGSDPIFLYNDVQGGKDGFAGTGAGTNYTGLYENNIDDDPSFRDTTSEDYSLLVYSHCIGAGIDSLEVEGKWYCAPEFCFMGIPRPSPETSRPDIGACESLLDSPLFVDVRQETINPSEYTLFQNYPNPFNPSTKIKYGVKSREYVSLKVYNILGNEVVTLVNEEKPAGTYEVIWNAANLPSGVYFYQLKVSPATGGAGNYTATKKLLLLK